MSAKLLLHTVLCLCLAAVLVVHIRRGRRPIQLTVLAAAALWLAAAPFLYRFWPGGVFPRITVSWAQLLFVGASLAAYTPRPVRECGEPVGDGLDPTAPAPLCSPQSERRPTRYH
jgi:hypothetical protein